MAGVLSTGLLALAAIANALPQASTGSSCQQLGNNTQQGAYTITCGTDRVGGDLSNGQSSSFSGCIPQCDALPGCVGFTYVMNSGFCYFKSSLTATSTDANVDVAVKPDASPSGSSSSAPASSTGTATATGTASSTSAAPTSAASGSCAAIGSGNTFDGGYTATCQTDAAGGDLSNAQASTFAACAPICDGLAGCIGFAYANGFCYFKSSQAPLSSNSNVDIAFKPVSSSSSSAAPSTTSSSASSSAAPTTTSSSSVAPSTTSSSSAAPSTTSSSSAAPTTTSSSSAAPTTTSSTTSSTRSSTSASSSSVSSSATSSSSTTAAAPAPTGTIINPVSPGGSANAQCTLLRASPQFKLSAVVTRGNRALNGLFLQTPSYTSLTSPPRLVSGSANGGQYVQTNSINVLNVLPSIASVTPSGTCITSGLALYSSSTEQGAVGLVPNTGTASTVDIATTVNYVFPFQLYTFGSFYACAAPGGATLRWIRNDASNFFGALYQTLDTTNCALVTLQKVLV